MRRIVTLTYFLIQDLFHSLACIVPLACTLAFGLIAFEYGMDEPQFITVGGIGMGAICLTTTLILASRANRASSFLLVYRLHQRRELLAALVLSGVAITTALALLVVVANLLAGRLTLEFPSALWTVPTWFPAWMLPAWLLAASLALPLSGLATRGGSSLIGYVLLVGLLVANDRRAFLLNHGMNWLSGIVEAVLWPVNTLFAQATAGSLDSSYVLAWVLTCAYSVLLFLLATSLFDDKDLLWSE